MKRLGLVPWLVAGAVLTAVQIGALAYAAPVGGVVLTLAVVGALLLQLLKTYLSVLRLSDLGLDPSRAALTALPPLNLFLLGALSARTPSEAERDKRRARWSRAGSLGGAVGKGMGLIVQAWPVVLGAALCQGLVAWSLEASVPGTLAQLVEGELSDRLVWFQGALAVFGALGLYLIVQLFKVKTASRVSWLPTLFVLPVGLFALALWPPLIQTIGVAPVVAVGYGAASFLSWLVLGGLVQPLWIHLTDDGLRHQGSVAVGRAVSSWRSVWAESAVVYGAMTTVVFLGLQALYIPGLIFAVALAFAVQAGTLERAERPFRISRQLARIYGFRVVLVLGLGAVGLLLCQIGAPVVVEAILSTQADSEFVEGGTFRPERVVFSTIYAMLFPGTVRLSPIGVGIASGLGTVLWAGVAAILTVLYRVQRPAEPSVAAEGAATSQPG